MDDILGEFFEYIEKDHNLILDYTEDSIISLEKWLNVRYSSHTEILKFDQLSILDGCSRYLGEYVIRN